LKHSEDDDPALLLFFAEHEPQSATVETEAEVKNASSATLPSAGPMMLTVGNEWAGDKQSLVGLLKKLLPEIALWRAPPSGLPAVPAVSSVPWLRISSLMHANEKSSSESSLVICLICSSSPNPSRHPEGAPSADMIVFSE
jgi:hypothetical protein